MPAAQEASARVSRMVQKASRQQTPARPAPSFRHHAEPGIRHSRYIAQTRASGLVGAERAKVHSWRTRTRTATHTARQQTIPASCRSPASPHSRCSAQTRASGLAGANGPKPTRGARATRPATSQHRVGRRRRGSDERRRTLLFARELLDVPATGAPMSLGASDFPALSAGRTIRGRPRRLDEFTR